MLKNNSSLGAKPPLVILAGPTAAGKTAVSLELARRLEAEIICADSMQVYKRMDIGTAKIPLEARQGIPHCMLDVADPKDSFNIAAYKEMATAHIKDIHSRGHIPLIVGGTGFYIRALMYDTDFSAASFDEGFRSELTKLASEKGSEYLHQLLAERDPGAAEKIHPRNTKRIIRALEFERLAGMPISAHNAKERERSSPYDCHCFVLTCERSELYRRIEARVDEMLEAGLEDEVRSLIAEGVERNSLSMQGLGYKQLYAYLEGEISLDEAIRLIKRDTRRYAKRQLTWFRGECGERGERGEINAIWIDSGDYGDTEAVADEIMALCLARE